MTFLPLLERELRVRARNRATFWTRFGVVLVAMVVCMPELLSGGFGNHTGSNGKFIFNGIVVIAFLLACGGCLLTADVISRERREGTLGLLLLTRVRNLDVLLGKFGSAGLTSICGLLALLPLMMIPVLAGGVTGGEAFRKGLALLNTLFLALASGLWASAKAKEQSRAVGSAVRMLAALTLLPMVSVFVVELMGYPDFPRVGPVSTLLAAADPEYKATARNYWVSLGLVQGAGWGLLLASAKRLRSVIEKPADVEPVRPRRSANNWWQFGAKHGLRNPIEFLIQQQRGIRATIWAAALVAFILQFGGLALMPFGFFGFLSITRWLPINIIPAALLAWAMSRFMVDARRSGEFELLATTPSGAKTIVSAQWNALKQMLWGPLLVMLVPYLSQVLMVGWRWVPRWSLDQMIRQWAFILFGLTNTIFGIAALCWAGLWFGFKARSQTAAIAWTVVTAKAVPFLIYLTSQGLFASGFFPRGIFSPYDVRWYVPQFLTLLFYVRLMLWVRARFARELAGAEPLRFTLLRLVSQDSPLPKIGFQSLRD